METTVERPDAATPAAEESRGTFSIAGLGVIDRLMAGGEILPTQVPGATHWTPEKKLAGAVLASALLEIRDHHGVPGHGRRVREAFEWIALDDGAWAFSFVRLCDLFGLEPEWVRAVVGRWAAVPLDQRKAITFLYRQAA
jgi:hypothetical protein